ncbi:TetR/AcrR family transcriptional regulator [Flectobacillus major]|jgi:AcrR family transcriptional regulator|uniref:TetR/AcrR family transcriptional regulator n=1 Tax=Flectobacillus major TaxID=103 RepID=UPI000400E4E6|nr:TetR/AcrR family transcriptional regulator [Flectobacillus major]
MYNTKQKILNSSIQLFNQNGIDAVRLQQIAEDTGISVGNLAYHFKNKDAIVESVYEHIFEDFSNVLRQYAVSTAMTGFDAQLSLYYEFFDKYQFYIADFFKTNNTPTEHQQIWQEYITKMLIQIKSRIDYLVLNQDFIPETFSGLYQQVAENVWTNLIFYIQKCRMRGITPTEMQYKYAVWNQLRPYFTESGLTEFNQVILPSFSY